MIKRIAKVVSIATVLLVSPQVPAQPSILDNTKPWSERMIESEMVRFPEAWQIDWDESAQWDYVHGLNLLAVSKVYQHTRDQRYLDYILGYYDMLVNDDGTISTYDIDKYNICLLYTSPSPRDGLLYRMPSSA